MFYNFYDYVHHSLTPLNHFLNHQKQLIQILNSSPIGAFFPYANLRDLYAFVNSSERATRFYSKPDWGIKNIIIDEQKYEVFETVVHSLPFCDLKRFSTEKNTSNVLLIAPLSGHYATLLRHTVQELLVEHNVFVTDWHSACEVPVHSGEFGMNEYVDYIRGFSHLMPEGYSAIAVCQPTVPATVAYAYMVNNGEAKALPNALVLMGGPMVLSGNETEVTKFAMSNQLNWFRNNLVHKVPFGHSGYGREVYPGFIQLMSFISMNLDKHVQAQFDIFNFAKNGNYNEMQKKEDFYDEYLAVLDLDAKFYLETIDMVFQRRLLEKGEFGYRDHVVALSDLKSLRVLAVEGENDDIACVGQTSDALDKMVNISDANKQSYVANSVGHYGIFSGKKWAQDIRPLISRFIA